MKHLGDFDTSAVVYGKFTTFRPSTGAAYTLAGTPALSVYKDNSTTQSTTGVTLTADFDSVTGLNHFAIDTSADGTFYSTGSFFDVVITTGTVDSVSVVGAVVGSFTLRKNSALKPATAGRTVVVDASGLVDANTVKVGPTGSGTAQTARDIGASVLLSSGTGTGQLDFTSGVVKANATQIAGSAVSTTTAQIGVNAVQISGDSVAADNCESFFDGTGYGPLIIRTTIATVNSQTSLTLNTTILDQSLTGSTILIRRSTTGQVIAGTITAVSAGEQVDFTANGTAGYTITTADTVEIVEAKSPAIGANVTKWNGTAVASPATAGVPEVNVKNINNVATTSVTTVNANQGTTQPINFTGSGASALAKSDMVDVAGAAVSTTTAQIGVNAVQLSGDSTAADNAERFFDGTGYGPLLSASTVATVNSQTSLTLNVTNLDQSLVGATVVIRDVSGGTLDEAIVGAITAVSAGEQVDFTVNGTAGFTIAAGDRVEILPPGASAKRIWDELKSGHTTAGTFGYYLDSRISTISGGGGSTLTVDATYVDAPHTWTFQNSTQLTSPKIISEYIGFNGLLCLDLNSVLPPEVAISSIGTVAFANISGTEPTVGTATVSTNLRKVLIPVDATSATANRYTLSVTVTSTDSQTITRKGQFDVS